jgi:hypothetical protein
VHEVTAVIVALTDYINLPESVRADLTARLTALLPEPAPPAEPAPPRFDPYTGQPLAPA